MKKTILLSIAFLFIMLSCEKEKIYDEKNTYIIINNNLKNLNKRVTTYQNRNIPIVPLNVDDFVEKSVNEIKLQLIAEVMPPIYQDISLQASHIKIVNNFAFVVYNKQGDIRLGGVDIFNISNINNPILISSAIFPGKDISSIDIDYKGIGLNNHVYLAGAENLEYWEFSNDSPTPPHGYLNLNSDAIVERYLLNSANQFMHVEDARQYYDITGYVATDVRYFNNKIYVTSGTNGGLTILNNGMNLLTYTDIYDARSVDVNNTKTAVFKGQQGEIFVYNQNNVKVNHIITGGANIPESKSMIRISNNFGFVALGTDGMKIYNLDTGALVDKLDVKIPDNTEYPENYVTNGVAINNNILLVANGGAGIYVANFSSNKIQSVGVATFEDGSSANFIDSKECIVFVATGLGGLKILKIN